MRHDLLPKERVVVRFAFHQRNRRINHWLLIEKHDAEVCRIDPGFGDDVVVEVTDRLPFARWHTGRVSWSAALRSGGIKVTGRRELCRDLPTWNEGPQIMSDRRAKLEDASAV